jgi:sugar-specific transcriptional regulator TrmB
VTKIDKIMELKEVLKQLKVKEQELNKSLSVGFQCSTEWSEITDESKEVIKTFLTYKYLLDWLKPQVKINTTRENLIKAMVQHNVNIGCVGVNAKREIDEILACLKEVENK